MIGDLNSDNTVASPVGKPTQLSSQSLTYSAKMLEDNSHSAQDHEVV